MTESSSSWCNSVLKCFASLCRSNMTSEEPKLKLGEEIVEAWLDDHTEFTHNYFLRKASQTTVNSWLANRVVRIATVTAEPDELERCSSSPTPSTASSSESRTPRRKISVEEINPRSLALKPMVKKDELGSPLFYRALESQAQSLSSNRRQSTQLKIEAHQRNKTRRISHHTMPDVKKEMKVIDERDIILELVKDITMELDITTVSHKILQNVTVLLDADRCSLFLMQEKDHCKYLVSRLFDVSKNSCIEDSIVQHANEIRLELGKGIAGKVAETGETLNIPDAYADERFNQDVDTHTGYKTSSILCMPLLDGNKRIVGVAQAINKHDHQSKAMPFTKRDEKIFASYLGFCGIAVHNAQLFEKSEVENRRNEVLLDLTKILFEEQTSVSNVMTTILQHVNSLLKCERVSIMLLNENDNEGLLFKEIYEHVEVDEEVSMQQLTINAKDKRKVPFNLDITTKVSQTGEAICISDAKNDNRFRLIEDTELGFTTKHLLCMPICASTNRIIGVIQLINRASEKESGFTLNDQQLLEAFTIFCALGICQARRYEEKTMLLAKQNVLLEILSYHVVSSEKEALAIAARNLPSAMYFNLNNFSFDDGLLKSDETIIASIRMFTDLNLIDKFHINYQELCRWICTVRKNYRDVKYHNWRHAFNVCQTMYCMLKQGGVGHLFNDFHKLGLLIACLSHDLDHRGTNNAFQFKSQHPLARLYSTSTLEQHHFNQCLMLLQSNGCNVLANLSAEVYEKIVKCIKHAIISTDLAVYFKNRDKYFKLANEENVQWNDNSENLNLLMGMVTTGADTAAICKPWEIQYKVAHLVAEEFFEQGDIEKDKLNLTPTDMMNRSKSHKLPEMQVGFIDSICLPLYKALAKTSSGLQPLLDGCLNNRENWKNLQNN